MKRKGKVKISNNLFKRILARFMIGVAFSLIVGLLFLLLVNVSQFSFSVFGNWPDTVQYIEASNQYFSSFESTRADILFAALSLVFLVISFVSLLAGKTESIYWVDAIHYHLIEPRYFSIIDMATYLFSALVCCTMAYLLPELPLDFMSVSSFVIIIVFLAIMSFKLLIAFFAKDNTKRKLRKEYESALDYRRIAYQSAKEPQMFFDEKLYRYGEQYGAQEDIAEAYIELIEDKSKLEKFGKEDKRRFLAYEKRYGGDINAFAKMRDGLFANLLDCIERNSIPDIVEQVSFLAEYHEYNLVFFAFDEILNGCPAAIPTSLGALVPVLSQCSKEKKDELYKEFEDLLHDIAKSKNYSRIANKIFFDSLGEIVTECDFEILTKLINSNELSILFFSEELSRKQTENMCYQMANNIIKRTENLIEQEYVAAMKGVEVQTTNGVTKIRKGISDLILKALTCEKYDIANHIMHYYMQFLERVSLQKVNRKECPANVKEGVFPLGILGKEITGDGNKETLKTRLLKHYTEEELNTNNKLDEKRREYLSQLCWYMPSELLEGIEHSVHYVDIVGDDNGIKCLWNIFANCTGIYDLELRFPTIAGEELLIVESIKNFFVTLIAILQNYDYPFDDNKTGKKETDLMLLTEYVVSTEFRQIWEEANDRNSELTKLVNERFLEENMFSGEYPRKIRDYFHEKFNIDLSKIASLI